MAPSGVRVNAVNPGAFIICHLTYYDTILLDIDKDIFISGVILTELFTNGGVDNREVERYLEQCKVLHPLGRAGRPEEVATAIGFLASGEVNSEHVTMLRVNTHLN